MNTFRQQLAPAVRRAAARFVRRAPPCVLATALGILPPALAAQPVKDASEAAIRQLRSAESRRDRLRDLTARLERAGQAGQSLAGTRDGAQDAWEAAQEAAREAEAALDDAARCLRAQAAEIASGHARLDAAAGAVLDSHRAVEASARASGAALVRAARLTDQAFDRRKQAEDELAADHARFLAAAQACASLVRNADWRTVAAVDWTYSLAAQAKALPTRLGDLAQAVSVALDSVQAARNDDLLEVPPVERVALPAGDALRRLERALADAPRAPVRATGLTPLEALQSPPLDILSLATDLARLEDAAKYLDLVLHGNGAPCRGAQCVSLAAERRDLARRMRDARAALAAARVRRTDAALAAAQALDRTRAAAEANRARLRGVEPLVAPALAEAAQAAKAAADRVSPLAQAADRAYAAAQRDWRLAYSRVYGAPPVEAAATGTASFSSSVAAAMISPQVAIEAHAYDVFAAWNKELPGFGAYTYILLRSVDDLKRPDVRRRFERAVDTARRGEIAGAKVPGKERPSFNLICVPGRLAAGARPETGAIEYDSDLGNQLKLRAHRGLLARAEVRERLTRSPGPFLITVPGRIADAQRDWPLLFADLNDYDDDTISDLVVSYKAGLIDAFPKDQAMWRPPAEQRVALFMIRALRGSGEILVSALPTARATPR